MPAPLTVRRRFDNSLDLTAARSMRPNGYVKPSGTGNAWSMVDSPTLGRLPDVTQGSKSVSQRHRLTRTIGTPAGSRPIPKPVAPLNIKKIRRRGLMNGIKLVLPPSPLPLLKSPRFSSATPQSLSPASVYPATPQTASPQTALTFTAEWDLTQRTFVFTPFESAYPRSALSPRFIVSPVPDDIDGEVKVEVEYPPTPNPAGIDGKLNIAVVFPPTPGPGPVDAAPSSPTSSCSTSFSEIFDMMSISSSYSHGRKMSQSTELSSASAIDLCAAESSTCALTREMTLNLFEEELARVTSVAPTQGSADVDFDKGCYEEWDEDLLLAPMDAFERSLWDSTESDGQAVPWGSQQELRLEDKDKKPLPEVRDVPRNASVDSIAVSDLNLDASSASFIPSAESPRHLWRGFRQAFAGTRLRP